jgi:hypothetical protein
VVRFAIESISIGGAILDGWRKWAGDGFAPPIRATCYDFAVDAFALGVDSAGFSVVPVTGETSPGVAGLPLLGSVWATENFLKDMKNHFH